MQCPCGGHGVSSYRRFTTISEAEAAGVTVTKAPCVVVTQDCPDCRRHSQHVWYDPDARGNKVNLLELMRKS